MKGHLKVAVLFIISTFVMLAFPVSANACGAASKETNPRILVHNTEIIIRTTAVGYGDPPPPDSRVRFIEFRVEEVLKGENVPNTFLIRGILTDKDDFNDRPVPYDYVRPMGRGGSCAAYHYKEGAEFLLFLKRHAPDEEDSRQWGEVTPYWASMAATNEQLHSSDDAWLLWVKNYLRQSNGEPKNGSYLLWHDTPNNGMHPTANSAAFMRETML